MDTPGALFFGAYRAKFREFIKDELPRTPEAEVKLPRRGTMTTPAIGQEEEAKDRGFLEKAPARPAG